MSEQNKSYFSHQDVNDHLACKRKTVLKYINPDGPNAKLPTMYYQIYWEERKFKQAIFNQLAKESDTIYIKDRRNKETRSKETKNAIEHEYDFIFNAQISYRQNSVKIDALAKQAIPLEGEDSKMTIYIPWLITNHDELSRNHLVNLFYAKELLKGITKIEYPLVFYTTKGNNMEVLKKEFLNIEIVKNKVASTVDEINKFLRRKKEDLLKEFPPVLKNDCFSCKYRYQCIPQLLETQSISLLSEITPRKAMHLHSKGITSLEDIKLFDFAEIMNLGFDEEETNKIIEEIPLIQENKPVFKTKFHSAFFDDVIPVTIGFYRQKGKLAPSYILFKEGKLKYINFIKQEGKGFEINKDDLEIFTALLNKRIVAYGTDATWLKEFIQSQNNYDRMFDPSNFIDLSKFIDNYVNAPFWGKELPEMCLAFDKDKQKDVAKNGIKHLYLTGKQRISLLENLIEYLKSNMS